MPTNRTDTALIAEARGLAEAATPGPWQVTRRRDREAPASVCADVNSGRAYAIAIAPRYASGEFVNRNGPLIAASPTLVPALCDALERSNAERDEARAQVAALRHGMQASRWVQPRYNGNPSCAWCGQQQHLHDVPCEADRLLADTASAATAHDAEIVERCAAVLDRHAAGWKERAEQYAKRHGGMHDRTTTAVDQQQAFDSAARMVRNTLTLDRDAAASASLASEMDADGTGSRREE